MSSENTYKWPFRYSPLSVWASVVCMFIGLCGGLWGAFSGDTIASINGVFLIAISVANYNLMIAYQIRDQLERRIADLERRLDNSVGHARGT